MLTLHNVFTPNSYEEYIGNIGESLPWGDDHFNGCQMCAVELLL